MPRRGGDGKGRGRNLEWPGNGRRSRSDAMTTQMYLTPADRGRALTREEFENAHAQEGYQYELIEGKLEVSPLPNLPHDRLRKWLGRLFDDCVARRPDVI